jgi:predicted YcjX-like family ATPase
MDFQKQMSIGIELSAHVGELILVLYQQKLTYAEFAQKQYESGRDALAAELTLTQAIIERDDDRRVQAEQEAEQQFANVAKGWTDYIQSVNARQPHTVNAHGVR